MAPTFDVAAAFEGELADAPTDERVYRVALQLHEPARIADIADRADCTPDTARRHCRRLADIGVLEAVSEQPETYRRNESYFEWRKRDRLAELSTADLRERLADLTDRDATFRETYGVSDPDAVDALEHAEYDAVEEVWLDVSEWRTVRRRIERLEAVRQRRANDSASHSEPA